MTIGLGRVLGDDPALPYNVVVEAANKKEKPTRPLRVLVGNNRLLSIIPWLAESDLETVARLWMDVHEKP